MIARPLQLFLIVLGLAGCVQPYQGAPIARSPDLATQDQTARTEEQDRIARFRRLAEMQGIAAPAVEETELPPGSVDFMSGPVPVVRVVFSERAFFAFDSDTPLPSAAPILDLIAENMRRDVPDAALTVLGHTDAIGTDAYNIALSRRRAQMVLQALVARGVNADQLSEVAIGKRQPIAPNDTDDGRALNRRVEFLISPAMSANLAAVQQRVVPASYFRTDDAQRRAASADTAGLASIARVYKLIPSGSQVQTAGLDENTLRSLGGLPLSPVAQQQVYPAAIDQGEVTTHGIQQIALAPTLPVAPVHLVPPDQIEPRQLGSDITY